tara:strand:+ start:1703 stop:2074 length:372 start_codon:yes stop_codon:yes gene_type:complete
MTYQELLAITKYFIIFNELFNNNIVILHELHDICYIKHNDNFILISETTKELNKIPNLKNYLDNCIYFEENLKNKPLQLLNISNLPQYLSGPGKLNINFIQTLQFHFILDKVNQIENNYNLNT